MLSGEEVEPENITNWGHVADVYITTDGSQKGILRKTQHRACGWCVAHLDFA